MGDFFQTVFPDVDFNLEGETQVCCPFPHKTSEGEDYYETNPSAGINLEKGLFHCFMCGTALREVGFMAKFMDIPYEQASILNLILNEANETEEDWEYAHQELLKNVHIMDELKNELKISEEVIKELKLGFEGNRIGYGFPVFLFGKLVDVATYRPNQHPKVLHRTGSKTGMIIPYQLWKNDNRSTIICAGQKDMAIARTHKFNAITFTGGEGVTPDLFINDFKDKTIYIVYDNDVAGKEGAAKVAMSLYPVAKSIKIVDLSDVCIGKGEDLHDYFVRYRKTREDFIIKLREASEFSKEDYDNTKEKQYPTVRLIEATNAKHVGKVLRSNIQVTATFETQFIMPSIISAIKIPKIEENPNTSENLMRPGETRHWYLNQNNIKDMLYLIDSNLKEHQIKNHIRNLLNISSKEINVQITQESKHTVYKCSVTDAYESLVLSKHSNNNQRVEFLAYSLNKKLENGVKYQITYKLVPHPFDGQKLVMIILDVESANDSVTKFKITPDKIELLKQFQVETTVENKVKELVERVKGLIGEDRNNIVILLEDLWYHTVLQFNIGRLKNIRGYLDMLIVGESRLGKSTTFEALMKVYGLGTIIDLGGTHSTIAGLIGGSNKVNGSYQTRAGLIPQNNRGAIAFEELGRCKNEIIQQLTDIRSSNEARIVRVDGELRLQALVRMLTLSNTKEKGGNPRPMTSYPNGIEIITDLIKSAADIARYDLIACLYETAATEIDPFYEPPTPLSEEAYQTRIRWIWSRNPDQIIIDKDVYVYTIEKSNQLNKIYQSHINIFGIEVWKKITRLATAVASYVVSTDETFENIVVKKEHIDYATDLFVSLYDNESFRFKQYVEEERRRREIDEEGVKALQDMFFKYPTILLHLESNSETTRNTLQAISGLEPNEFSNFMNSLVRHLLIEFSGYNIIPTERFRKGMAKINRKTSVPKVGEVLLRVTN